MNIDEVFKKLADSLPFMMVFVNQDLKYVYVNKQFQDFFQLSVDDIKGESVDSIVTSESAKKFDDIHQQVLAGQDISAHETIVLADGRRLKLDINYVPNINDEGVIDGFFAVVNDVTPYVSVTEVLRAVHDVVNRQSQAMSTDRIDNLLKLGCHYLNTDWGLVSRIEGERYCIHHSYSQQGPHLEGSSCLLTDTYANVVATQKKVVTSGNVTQSPLFASYTNRFGEQPVETYLGVPININGQLWGVLSFSSPDVRIAEFNELDEELMGLLASAVETIILNNSKTNRLERLAYTDFLTGLTNRLYISEQLERIHTEQTLAADACFALIDIDHFKSINDSYGHDAGDEVLREVAFKLADVLRSSDICSRVGGEEFAVVITDASHAAATDILERARSQIEQLEVAVSAHQKVSVTVSIGATKFNHADEFNAIYKRADVALYESKNGGRNQLTWS